MMKVLMVAADPMEFTGIVKHASGVRPAEVAVDWARHAELSGNTVLLVTNGAGARRACAAVDVALSCFAADAIVNTGFCGALSPALEIAGIVTATAVRTGNRRFAALPVKTARPHHAGEVVSIDHVARTAEEKRSLHQGGALAVEMEAGGVAERAAVRDIGFYCVRAVSDLATEDMSNDFNAALREDGHFATISILIGTLRKPFVRLPELVRLRNRCVRAAHVLGDFIADCRF